MSHSVIVKAYPYMDALIPLLSLHGIITPDEKTFIASQQFSADQASVLFRQILPAKGPEVIDTVIRIFESNHLESLAECLKQQHERSAAVGVAGQVPANQNAAPSRAAVDLPVVAAQAQRPTGTMRPSDFAEFVFLNRGAYGQVYKANWTASGDPSLTVAIKKLKVSLENEINWRDEVDLLQRVNHPHIVSILSVVDNLSEGEIWIVMELMNEGPLDAYCYKEKKDVLNVQQKVHISIQCWSALSYLHDNARITHQDIKPENILLSIEPSGTLTAKLCDFGLAQLKERLTITENLTAICGTMRYLPPEWITNARNHRQADVYALGVTLCELFSSQRFWQSHQEQMASINQADAIAQNASRKLSLPSIPEPIRDVLKRTLSFDRHQRPLASEALEIFRNCASTFSR